MTITIQLELEVDKEETIKEAVYRYLLELIDDDSLNFKTQTNEAKK